MVRREVWSFENGDQRLSLFIVNDEVVGAIYSDKPSGQSAALAVVKLDRTRLQVCLDAGNDPLAQVSIESPQALIGSPQESQAEESGEKSKSGNWVKWRILILRTWAVDFLPTPSHWAATTRVF